MGFVTPITNNIFMEFLTMSELKVLITVDWEGTDLEEENLQRIQKFKHDWGVPLTHYLNPGYYTNPNTCDLEITKTINNILSEEDDTGLHIHAPKHFVSSAGVHPRVGPCFSSMGDYNIGEEHGQEVMLNSFSKDEIDKMIKFSINLMGKYGFKKLNSFRAGGWMSDDAIFESLQENKIFIESSATVASLLEGSSWEGDNLQRYISIIWDQINMESRPYFLNTKRGKLLEIPNNLGAVDYWQHDWIEQLANKAVDSCKRTGNYIAVINSHQETALKHWYKLDRFLEILSLHQDIKLTFCTNSQVASEYMSA